MVGEFGVLIVTQGQLEHERNVDCGLFQIFFMIVGTAANCWHHVGQAGREGGA